MAVPVRCLWIDYDFAVTVRRGKLFCLWRESGALAAAVVVTNNDDIIITPLVPLVDRAPMER